MMVLKEQLRSWVEILRRLTGSGGRRPWKPHERNLGVQYWVAKWGRAVEQYTWRDEEQRRRALSMTGRNPEHWRLRTDVTVSDCEEEIRAVLRALHGRRRKELRRQISENCRRREQRRVDRQLASVISSMTNKFSPSMEMDELRIDDERSTAEPMEIHNHLTEWFEGAYRGSERTGRGVHAPGADWQSFLSDRAAYDQFLEHTSLNVAMKDSIWSALRVYQERAPELYEAAGAAALTIPTLAQFQAAIRRPRGGMTGGITGCTFNMMSQWSEKAIEALHLALASMSEEGAAPAFWNRRWLAVVPKAGEKSIQNMRPITLVEVLAKLWHGFSVSALWDFVEGNRLMCDSNHAYRRNRGCITATMQLIDVIDTARENESAVCICSTDVSKAFDSPSVGAQKIATARVCIPPDVASRIVDESTRPLVIVRSPVAHLSVTRTVAGYPDGECVLAFTPVRGIGQGTKDSTIKWNLVEDITNVALAQHVTDDDFLLLRADNSIARVCNICYSDDNNPISATVEGLERRADIVSCVKEVLEMKMATQKWKVVGANYGNERLIQRRTISVGDGEGLKTVLLVPKATPLRLWGISIMSTPLTRPWRHCGLILLSFAISSVGNQHRLRRS